MKIGREEKEKLRNKLYKKDERKCHYCGIKEEDFIQIWEEFYGGEKRGKKLEVDRKGNKKVIMKKIAFYLTLYVIMLKAINLHTRSLKR